MSFGKLCVVFLALLKSVLCQTHITVNTNLGQIVGIESQFEGERVFTFYSVPYAEPPERFKKPKPVQPWSTQRSAVTHGKLCVQTISKEITQILPNSEVSEDCLYVDLYIPKSISTENKKAVVIFIPSSNDFEVAFTTAYPLKYLAAEGDIILVIVSFRVDVFGFISTDDDLLPGNYGLWDQHLAITWVNDNIAAFGGDPSRITLMGVMTGAMSVGFQASYPMNKGKFQRISAFMAFSNSRECLVHNAKSFAKKIAKSLCPHQNGTLGSRQIYDCLVVKSAAELIQASANVLSQSPPSIGYPLGPVVDNDFILHEGHGNHTLSVDMYVSMSRYEGYHALFEMAPMIELQYGIDIKQGVPKSVLCHFIIEKIFNQYYQNTANSNFRNLICDVYTRADYTEQSIAAVELLGDAIYFSPVITALNKHAVESAKKNRFLSLVSSESKLVSSKFPWLGNAISGSSFVFLLLKDFVVSYGLQYPQEVIATSVKLVFYWSNFVKTGYGIPYISYSLGLRVTFKRETQ